LTNAALLEAALAEALRGSARALHACQHARGFNLPNHAIGPSPDDGLQAMQHNRLPKSGRHPELPYVCQTWASALAVLQPGVLQGFVERTQKSARAREGNVRHESCGRHQHQKGSQ
jgi:hypothetical protein